MGLLAILSTLLGAAGAEPVGVPVASLPVARWPVAAPSAADLLWDWPVVGQISSMYGPRWGRTHAGLDLAAPLGSPVLAACAGTVTEVGPHGSYGLRIVLSHPGGWTSVYGHLTSADVAVGDVVRLGEGIGGVGESGNATGPHLHLEVRLDGEVVDPLEVLP